MEFFIYLLLSVVTLYFLSYIFKSRTAISSDDAEKVRLPPGSRGWPFIGETLEYLSTAKEGVPEKFVTDRRKKYNPKVFQTSFAGEPMAMLCTHEGNKLLFSNENKLVQSYWPRNFDRLFAYSGKTTTAEESLRLQKAISKFLKPDALQRYVEIMDAATKQHLQRHWNHGEVKVHPLAKNYTLTIACRIFLDVADPDIIAKLEKPMQRISDGFVALPINLPGTIYSRALRASKQLRKDVEQIIKQRRISINLENRESPKQDLLSQMLMDTYTDGQLMKDSDIAYKIFGLIVAAFDNTSTTLVTIINCLAEMPQVYDRVLREQMEIASSKGAGELLSWGDIQKMRYSWHVACEVLRLFPPAPGTFRVAITDFMYEGFRIPKGFKLHWSAFATHKSPEYFSDPEKFDPSRFEGSGPVPFSYVPFGGGPRMCPGKEYARLKVLIFLHNLVTEFRWEKVFAEEKIIYDPILKPTKGLHLRLYPLDPDRLARSNM